jgi:hypothetical protein
MPRFRVAHLRQQGQDMIIVPLESSFGNKSSANQHAIVTELQAHARGAGLAGKIVPVWESGGGMRFIAPPPWHPFYQSLSIQGVMQNLNKEIFW